MFLPVSFSRMKGELDALPPGGCQHGVFTIFRRTAASGMAGLGTAPHVIEAVGVIRGVALVTAASAIADA